MSEGRKIQVSFEMEVRQNGLGPWVELVIVREDGKRRGIMSEPINSNYNGGIDGAAWGIVTERLAHALREIGS